MFEQNENKFFRHSQNVKNKIDYALINEIHCVTIVSFHRLVQIDNILSSVFTTIRPIFFIQEKTGKKYFLTGKQNMFNDKIFAK